MHPRWPLLIAVCLVLAICPAVHGEAPTLKAKKREKKKTAAPRTDRHGEPLPEGAVARLGTYRLRHRWEITSMALSPDAKRIATRSGHGAIKVWDAVTGRGLHCLEPRLEDNQFDNPPGPAFSPDGKYLAAACALDVCLWDAATGRELRRFGGFDKSGLPFSHLLLVAFSADGKSLVAAATDGILRRWDVATGKETGIQDVFAGKKPRLIHNKFREESVSAATLSADGRILAVEVTRHKDDGDSGEMRSGGQSVSAVGQGVRVQDTVSGKELSRVGGLE
ncbi:MAG TPA: hypothetical protein VKD72_02900, partial [Gemmataceae bacterium]|nr:hypothetical protein [Gemmataceae bacterium]